MLLAFVQDFVRDAGRLKGDGDHLPPDCPEVSKGECNRCPLEECENHPVSEADATCFVVANMEEK